MNTKLKHTLKTHWPIIGILTGTLLLWISLGPYTNWDAQTELEAATNTLNQGFPYLSTGYMINQPPLGFYTQALTFKTFKPTYTTGTNTVTLFGLGSLILVYTIGNQLYDKKTALIAAALFGLTPLQAFMARTFLIDAQCLFLSLLYLLAGILAIQKKSDKLVILSGTFFALALLTKLFSVYMLTPLALMLHAQKPEGFSLTQKRTLLFTAPAIITQTLWYAGFAHQNFIAVYFHSDFTHPIQNTAFAPLFLPKILTQTTGCFLLLAAALSLTLALLQRKTQQETQNPNPDLSLATTAAVIFSLNLLLVFAFRLNTPYVSSAKYIYQSLPILCILAASITTKNNLLQENTLQKNTHNKKSLLITAAVIIGLIALAASALENTTFLYTHASANLVVFKVDATSGFPFELAQHTHETSQAQTMQTSAYAIIALTLLTHAYTKPRTHKKQNPQTFL